MSPNRQLEAAAQSLGMLLKRAEQAMLRSKNAALKPIGLTLGQYVALSELEEQQGITAATLARACFVSPQAMMILLKTMEQQGLIARRAHPRHTNVLELNITDVGQEALYGARARMVPLEKKILSTFSDKELKSFRASLAKFVAATESCPL
jgi:DNA-binding MarR family transcriptional regulator